MDDSGGLESNSFVATTDGRQFGVRELRADAGAQTRPPGCITGAPKREGKESRCDGAFQRASCRLIKGKKYPRGTGRR